MKKLMLLSAIALTCAVSANGADQLERVWLQDGVGAQASTTRQGVGHNGKFYLLNSSYGGGAGVIEVWGENGKESTVAPESGTLAGMNITIDDAGNIIARQGAFPNEFKGAGNTAVFIYNPETGAKKTFDLDDSKIMAGRCDFWGHVAGDVMSEEGGILLFGTNGQGQFNEVKIANGEHILGGQKGQKNNYWWWSGFTAGTTCLINNYDWMPNEAAAMPGATENVSQPIYHMVYKDNGEGIYVWSQDGKYVLPMHNNTNGFALFQMGDETYIVYSRGGNNADAVAVAKARVQRDGEPEIVADDLLCAYTYGITGADDNTIYNGTFNTTVHFNVEVAEDGKTATIYQYSPRNFVSVLKFTPEQPVIEDPAPTVTMELNRLWLQAGVAGQASTTRQGVGHDGKFYLLNSSYGGGAGVIEVWGENGKESTVAPESGTLAGMNINIDDAGNIIARQGAFPNDFKGDGNTAVFVYNPETGAKKTFNLDDSKIMAGRGDFWGHVAGNVLSEEGGLLLFGTNGQSQFNEVKIVNGEHIIGGQKGQKNNYWWWSGFTAGTTCLINNYDWMPNEAAAMPGADGSTSQPVYHMVYKDNGEGIYVWSQDGKYVMPQHNVTNGFALFKMGDETYIVYSRGGNNADAVAVAKARVQRDGEPEIAADDVLCAFTYGITDDSENTIYNGTFNTTVHFNVEVAEDGKTATIYQYSPRNFVSVLEFKVITEEEEPQLPEIESLTALADAEDDTDVIIATPLTVIVAGGYLNLVTDGESNIGLYTEAPLEAGDIITAGFEATYTQHALTATENNIVVDGKGEVPAPIPVTAEDLESCMYEWMYLDLQNVIVTKTMEAYDILTAGQASMVDGDLVIDLWIEDLLGVCQGMTPGAYNITGFFVEAPVSDDDDETILKFVPTAYTALLPEIESLTNLVDLDEDTEVIIATPLTVIVAGGYLNLVTDGVSNIGLFTEAPLEEGDIITAGFQATYAQNALMAIENQIVVDGKGEVPAPMDVTADIIDGFMYEWLYLNLEHVVTTKTMEAYDILSNGEAAITDQDGTISVDLWIEDLLGVCQGMEAGTYDIVGFFIKAPVSDENDEMILKFVPTSYRKATDSIESIEVADDAVYYDIKGIRVDNPANGKIYIKVQNAKASKVAK